MSTRRRSYNPLLKSYPDSEKINSVSEGAECLYCRLIAQSDDAGRYYADPRVVLAKLFTHRMVAGLTVEEVASRLDELEASSLIKRYEVDGKKYLQIVEVVKALRKDLTLQFFCPEPVTDVQRLCNETATDVQRSCNGIRSLNSIETLRQPNPTEPNPTQPNQTEPDSAPAAPGGSVVFTKLSEADLRNPKRVVAWLKSEHGRPDGMVRDSEQNRINVVALAAKIVADPKVTDEVGLFKWIVRGGEFAKYLNGKWDDVAAAAIRQMQAERTETPISYPIRPPPSPMSTADEQARRSQLLSSLAAHDKKP